jgi:sugar lactone lactonase YvrE
MSHGTQVCPRIAVMLRALYALLLIAVVDPAAAQIISTFAGPGLGGVGAPGIQAEAIAADRWGNIYTAEPTYRVVRRIDHETGAVTIIAGTGQAGYSGDGGPATQAMLDNPTGVALDRAGNVFIAEPFAHVVRRVDRDTGVITTVAGPGTPDVPNRGDGGPATQATMYANDVAVNREGDLYIADSAAGRIRRVDHRTGIISTVVDLGNTYIVTMAFDPHGNLYVVDPVPPEVVRFDARSGAVTKVAGAGGCAPQPGGSACYNGDGILATDAFLNFPTHITFDCAGNLTISDTFHFRVRQVNRQTGIITTIAGNGQDSYGGDGGLATQTGIGGPRGLAFGPQGDLFFAEPGQSSGYIRKVSGLPKTGHRCEERDEDRDGRDAGRPSDRTDRKDGGALLPWWW